MRICCFNQLSSKSAPFVDNLKVVSNRFRVQLLTENLKKCEHMFWKNSFFMIRVFVCRSVRPSVRLSAGRSVGASVGRSVIMSRKVEKRVCMHVRGVVGWCWSADGGRTPLPTRSQHSVTVSPGLFFFKFGGLKWQKN